MALDSVYRFPDNLSDEIGVLLREMRSLPTWTARKYELFAEFQRLAGRKAYLRFTADSRDYRLSGSGNSCLYRVPFSQRGALSVFAGKFIRVVCGGKTNRYSGRYYYAKPVSKRSWRQVASEPAEQEGDMTDRYLTITLQPDWKGGLRAAAKAAQSRKYQGEVLNFETPAQFFGQLTEKRWDIVRAAQGKGELSIRGLARMVGRDVKRVHEDIVVLAELGLLERTETGGVVCPYTSMHIDMVLNAA